MTFDHDAEPLLHLPVIDDALHAVVVPMSRAVRVAGTAEFAGYNLALPRQRIENLQRLLRQVLGWTMAAGSAELLSDMISGCSPVLDPELYSSARFHN